VLTTSCDIIPHSTRSLSRSVVAIATIHGCDARCSVFEYRQTHGKLHLTVAWCSAVIFRLSQNCYVFLLTDSSSSILGKHGIRFFIGVISCLKRFPFWFSRVTFVVIGILYLPTVPMNCCISAIYNIPLRLLPRRIVTMGTFRL